MFKKILTVAVLNILFICCCCYVNLAKAVVIKDIRVVGNHYASSEFIKQVMHLNYGSDVSDNQINLALQHLYNTDYFSDIKVSIENNTLIVNVKENSIINRIIFEGNKNLKDEDIKKIISLEEHFIFSASRLNKDIKTLRDQYLSKGFLKVSINYKIVQVKDNRIDIIFKINEGSKSKIDTISFLGNKVFSAKTLRSVILSRESHWWNIFTSNDTYNKNRIEYDGELLNQFYRNKGFLEFHLLSSFLNIGRDNSYQLVFNISEGPRYKFANLSIASDIARVKPYLKDLQVITTTNQKWFSYYEVQTIRQLLLDHLASLGFNAVDVRPDVQIDSILKTVNVVFRVVDINKNIIERINIVGNTKTYDSVIRRALNVREGDLLKPGTLETVKNNVYSLNYFDRDMNVYTVQGTDPDSCVLNIKVTDRNTGSISLSGGYSTFDGFVVQASFNEANINGSGNGIQVSASLSARQLNFDVFLYDPYFLDKRIYSSIRFYNTLTDYTSTSFYKINETGISYSIGYNLSQFLSQNITYSIARSNIFNILKNAPVSVKNSRGSRVSSIISNSFQYDRRDNSVYPTKGYLVGFTTDLAGLGGDVFYLRNTIKYSVYKRLYKDNVLSIITSGGYINKILHNHEILISDKFFLGGESLRGFAYAGIGPRDPISSSALGGNSMFRLSAQIDMPIPLVSNLGLKFHVFNDNGSVNDIDSLKLSVVKSSMKIRSSVGLGLSWITPFGLIAVDWGWPLAKQPQDITQRFLLSFGTRF